MMMIIIIIITTDGKVFTVDVGPWLLVAALESRLPDAPRTEPASTRPGAARSAMS